MTSSSGAPKPRTVVLVDDTPDVRALVRRALERNGGLRVVAEAGDGSAGLEAVRRHQPDAVLLDIAMPVMDGLEALPLIREASPQTTVIMLSGFGADQMVEKAMDAGAAGYIQKGRPMRELVSQVHTLLSDGEGGAGFGGPAGSPPGMLNRVFAAWRPSPRPNVALL
jgi:DNA-binding NarL/FixJ family response regulator